MAETSKREQIVAAVLAELEELRYAGIFKLVTRDSPEIAGPEGMASLQYPAIVLVPGLPQPAADSGHRGPGKRVMLSRLRIQVLVMDHANTGMDARVSNLADEVWRVLLADQLKGGLAVGSSFLFDEFPKIERPYVIFGGALTVTYQHTEGGI